MTQQTSPFLEGKYGWALGESGWNFGMDENLLKFSYMLDRNIDGVVSSLPTLVNGEAYFLSTDNRLYFAVGGLWSSSPTPKWSLLTVKSSGDTYQFNGTSLISVPSNSSLGVDVDALTTQVAGLDGMPSVAEFGIIPDGVTNWESSPSADWVGLWAAATTTGVRWPAGETPSEYYATGINFSNAYNGARMHFDPGSVLGGVFHLISGPVTTQWQISSAVRTSNVVTIVTTTAHGLLTGDSAQIRRTHQPYAVDVVSMNLDRAIVTVINTTTFTYPNAGPDATAVVSGTPLGPAFANPSPVEDVVITGKLTTTDRFGTINCKNCYVESVHVLNDPARHSAYPGLPARGAHLYVGTDQLRVDNLVIDYASGANTAAAFALDGNAWNPSNCSFGRVYVKDSAYTGAYITGGGHYFGELRVDGFAKEAPNGEILQDSNGLAQTNEMKGFWVNRCWDTVISSLYTNQKVQDGERPNDNSQALIDQTGHPSYVSTANAGLRIDSWFADNVRRNGIRFGDVPAYDSVTNVVGVGDIQVRMAPEGLTAGAYVIDCQGASGNNNVKFGSIRLIGTQNSLGVRVGTLAKAEADLILCLDHANQILQASGLVSIERIIGRTSSSGVPTAPLVNLTTATSFGSYIGSIDVITTINKSAQVFVSNSGAGKWEVRSISSQGYRSTSGTVLLDAPSTHWKIGNLILVGPDTTGTGVLFNGTIAYGFLGGGRVTGFSTGLAKGSATFTAATNAAVSTHSIGNTTATDLLAASFDKLACTTLTL